MLLVPKMQPVPGSRSECMDDRKSERVSEQARDAKLKLSANSLAISTGWNCRPVWVRIAHLNKILHSDWFTKRGIKRGIASWKRGQVILFSIYVTTRQEGSRYALRIKPKIQGKFITWLVNCWFSHDVTKIQTTKLLILLIFYFHAV